MDLKKHFLYKLAGDVKEICKPLFEAFGITYFNYSRVYPNNKTTILTTCPEWREYFINKGYQNIAIMDNKNSREKIEKYRIWDMHAKAHPNSNNLSIQKEAKDRFKLHHGLTICRDNIAFSERFTFATTEENHIINEHYEHSQDVFKKFTLYFKEQASTLIQMSDKLPIDYPCNPSKEVMRISESDFLDKIRIEKFYVETSNGSLYLTQRELDCISWAWKGKTIEETAIILNVSSATVKTHHFNVKQKFNVTKIIDILRILKEQDILELN